MAIVKRNMGWTALIAATLGLSSPALAQAFDAKTPIVGTWKISPHSVFNIDGPAHPHALRDASFTWIFAPEENHLRLRVYARYPLPAPTRTVRIMGDGKDYPCETRNSCWNSAGTDTGSKDAIAYTGPRETVAYLQITPYYFARTIKDSGKTMECVTLAVSYDGKVLTATSWHPETPYYQNVQIFDRVD